MLPDGRRINYGKSGVTIAAAPSINLGSRVNPNAYVHSSNSALTSSFMTAADAAPYPTTGSSYGANGERYAHGHQLGRQPSLESGLPQADVAYSSNPASAYGSPRDDEPRFGLGLSPVGHSKVLGVMDAPLPASFDPNGISHAARYGPWPASVPSKFGLESPSSSLANSRDGRTSETLKLLHTSAFGSNEHLSPSNLPSSELALGSSPPSHSISDEYFGKRAMHSSSYRLSKPRVMSSSAPKVERDWDAEFLFEEDYVPGVIRSDVLNAEETTRRGSLRTSDADALSDGRAASLTKFGSPGMATSPSRWGSLWQRQQDEAESGSLGKAMKHGSAFGHVGSPLRNSSLPIDDDLRGLSANGRPSVGGRSGSGPMSALTQQLQQTRLADGGPHLHPNSARASSGTSSTLTGVGRERDRDRGLERHVSSGSIGSSAGRFTTPIDEEDPAFVFNMEEVDDQTQRAAKRKSGGPASHLSYSSIVAGKGSGVPKGGAGIVESVGGR